MYFGNFGDKHDVCREFGIPDFEGTVVFAAYDTPDYDGYAEVIFVHKGKFYMAHGSHCSCYGLEDQWDPIEMPIDGLRKIIGQGTGMLSHYEKEFESSLDQLLKRIGVYEGLDGLEKVSTDTLTVLLRVAT